MNTISVSSDRQIQENYFRIMERIEQVASKSSRDPNEVKLIVVTKKQPVELIEAVISAGARNLGENYADEAVPKIEALEGHPQVQWHMIGHVQSRKAEMVCKKFDYIHSLDSLKLAERYNRIAGEAGQKVTVLLQFNVSGEESKSGWNAWKEQQWLELRPELEKIVTLEYLHIKGIMTMPPYFEDPENARPYFRRLAKLRDFLGVNFPKVAWNELSMGMSGDFEIAIQEGATWVRIGQAILGPRP